MFLNKIHMCIEKMIAEEESRRRRRRRIEIERDEEIIMSITNNNEQKGKKIRRARRHYHEMIHSRTSTRQVNEYRQSFVSSVYPVVIRFLLRLVLLVQLLQLSSPSPLFANAFVYPSSTTLSIIYGNQNRFPFSYIPHLSTFSSRKTTTTRTIASSSSSSSSNIRNHNGKKNMNDTHIPNGGSGTNNTSNTKTKANTVIHPRNHPGEDDEKKKIGSNYRSHNKGPLGLFSFFFRGKAKKGVSDIKMREAEELGGVPRSDRYSSRDWLHNTATLPSSAILNSIRGPVMFMTSWATFLSLVYIRLEEMNPLAAKTMCLPQSPHSLMVSALSLLLVFKTNSAYQRFAEGRKIWEVIVNHSRDLYRMMNLYEEEMGRTKRRRLQRLLAAFPYLLRHRIRPNLVMYRMDDVENVRDPENSIVLYQDRAADDLDPEAAAVATQEENEGKSRRRTRPLYWVDKRTLPWRLLPKNALEACARAQNRPLWVCDRMGQELRNIPDGPNFTARERLALIAKVEKLSGCIGACERIHQTAVPLNYARHSLRALTLWLFTLPFALVESLRLLTGPVLFLVSWLLFGVYEIGYSIEDPFQGTLRLSVLCDTIRRDLIADEVIRSTAFEIEADKPSGDTKHAVMSEQGNEENTKKTGGDSGSSGAGNAADTETKLRMSDTYDKEGDGEGDNQRDYEASTIVKPTPLLDSFVEEEGLYDEEDRDYESSPPISRKIPKYERHPEPSPLRPSSSVAAAAAATSANTASNSSNDENKDDITDLTIEDGGEIVDELPTISIIRARSLNTTQAFLNGKKP